ncbi:MAG: TolC family protein [Magnetococcales bacterium]|nr:TolC family protein [Magnetococcales bacterium]MBF0115038.1 TolC family protein [Magnetococcales bacterium]
MHSGHFFRHHARKGLTLLALSLLAGACTMKPQPFTSAEFQRKGAEDRALMFAQQAPLSKPITLHDAMARAVKFNLDRRAKMMEEVLALGQFDLDRFDMLPKLTANAGYVYRSDHATTTSRDSVTGQMALANPYYSLDKSRNVADLTLSWNILDFGASWYTAQQNGDRALIAAERRRKSIANLMQEVRYSYWRAVAAQTLQLSVRQAITLAEQALADARKVEKENLRNPAEALRYQKGLMDNLRQLENVDQELNTAKFELAALINIPPQTPLLFDSPNTEAMAVPDWRMPLPQMEELTFANNPDLREQLYQSRIAVDDTRKALLRLLPGINLSTGRQYDNNSFLMDHGWNEASARISFNLFNLLSAPENLQQAETVQKVAEMKRLALRMAVLAQVHVIHFQFAHSQQQFQRASEQYNIEARLADIAAKRQEGNAQSLLERINNQTSAIAANLRRYQSFAQMQFNLGRMQATLGIDPFPENISNTDLEELSALFKKRYEVFDQGMIPAEISTETTANDAS